MSFFLILLFVAIGVGSLLWNFSRSNDILQQWADENGYSILEAKYATFFKGPFFWTSTKGQSVYRVRVQDNNGNVRSGYVRCGSWAWGVLSNQTQVVWEE